MIGSPLKQADVIVSFAPLLYANNITARRMKVVMSFQGNADEIASAFINSTRRDRRLDFDERVIAAADDLAAPVVADIVLSGWPDKSPTQLSALIAGRRL